MTERERQMYQIIGAISELDAPIIFKGAMITKLILSDNKYTAIERQTKDIDANWTGSQPPTMNELIDIVNRALEIFNGELSATAIREYGDKKSAGIAIIETSTNNRVITLDISIKPVNDYKIYHYRDMEIKGVLANEIIADKLSVLSKKTIFRRTKDIIDLYALTQCVKIRTDEIYDVFNKTSGREIGSFDEFRNRRQDLEHAYNTLIGVVNKPPFDTVYAYLHKFIKPYIDKDTAKKIWNSNKAMWEDINPKTKSSILNRLAEAKIEANERNTNRLKPTRNKNIHEI